MNQQLTKLLATFFYIGYCPVASGTAATAAGVVISFLVCHNPTVYILLTGLITAVGFFVSDQMEEITRKKDPSCVVIDEVAGAMIALWMLPMNWPVVLTAFFLFRAFDMF